MKRILIPLLFLAASASAQLGDARQLIVSVGPEWNSTRGTMMLLEKTSQGWDVVRSSWRVTYGDSGMAWGVGVHPQPYGGRVKRTGDRCSPAGIFELGAFSGTENTPPPGVRYPYTHDKRPRKGKKVKLVDAAFKYAIAIKNDTARARARQGGVFLHLNTPNGATTGGGTAMDEEHMLALLQWLDPGKKPLLVQIPHVVYGKYMALWGLPYLP